VAASDLGKISEFNLEGNGASGGLPVRYSTGNFLSDASEASMQVFQCADIFNEGILCADRFTFPVRNDRSFILTVGDIMKIVTGLAALSQ